MSTIQVTGPINSGSAVVKNQSDETRSRFDLRYLVTEADDAVAALSLNQAITSALGQSLLDQSGLGLNYASVVRQNATARRVGPKKVEVTVSFGRSPGPPSPSGSEGVISFQARVTNVPVYRLPFNLYRVGENITQGDCAPNSGTLACGSTVDCFIDASSGCSSANVNPATGLPAGDFADTERVSAASNNGQPTLNSGLRRYPWSVPEVSVGLPAKISQASFYKLAGGAAAGDGAMLKVGFYNNSQFDWGTGTPPAAGVRFEAKTLRFDGVDANWVQENGVFVYYVNYMFTWRPDGWFEQKLIPDPVNVGFAKTQDANTATRVIDFGGTAATRIDFPLS